MFGYVTPELPELKVREYQRFRALYCGLCHELGRRYGLRGRMILNYDFVFLAALLSGGEETCAYCMRRCPVHPLRRRCVCAASPALGAAADMSVILTYRKLEDGAEDSRGLKRLGYRLAGAFLRRAYQKAASARPAFDGTVRRELAALYELEKAGCESLDATADKFAALLASAAEEAGEDARRPLHELLYHVGRIVYIADAWADLGEDFRKGEYNPVAARFALTDGRPTEEAREAVLATLMGSDRLAAAAFELLPAGYWTPVTENIVYLGIPKMIREVLDGTYRVRKPGLPKEPERLTGGTESEP